MKICYFEAYFSIFDLAHKQIKMLRNTGTTTHAIVTRHVPMPQLDVPMPKLDIYPFVTRQVFMAKLITYFFYYTTSV